MKCKINFSSLSKFRSELMGIATLMIIICHANPYGVSMPAFLSSICSYGNFGVDIFLLVSGIGLSFSLSKVDLSNRHDISRWYCKRYLRILVPYIVISLAILPLKNYLANGDWFMMLYNLSTLSFWTHHQSAWYVALLIPLYLLSPLFYKLSNALIIKQIAVGGVILAILSQSLSMLHTSNDNEIWTNITFCLCRTTSFFMGMALTPLVKSEKKINVLYVLLCFLPAYFLCHKIASHETFQVLQTIPIVAILVWLLEKVSKDNYFKKIIAWFGMISLESYLFNVYLNAFTKQIGINSYLLVIISGIILSAIFHYLSEKLINKIKLIINLK